MSGISEVKKKAKMSIDEMYDSQPVGKTASQEVSNQTYQKDMRAEVQPKAAQPEFKETIHPSSQADELSVSRAPFNQENVIATRPTSKPTIKMSFGVREEIHKAFNDLYAHRMLQGRKTDKSDMICEAIQLLIKMDNEQRKESEKTMERHDR